MIFFGFGNNNQNFEFSKINVNINNFFEYIKNGMRVVNQHTTSTHATRMQHPCKMSKQYLRVWLLMVKNQVKVMKSLLKTKRLACLIVVHENRCVFGILRQNWPRPDAFVRKFEILKLDLN